MLPREQWEAIEADLLGLGFTLSDVPDRVSWRAVLNWLRWAPEGSAVGRQRSPWSSSEHRLADLADLMQGLIYVTKRAHFNGQPPAPAPLPRPGVVEPVKPQTTSRARPLAEIDAVLAEAERRDRAGVRRMTPNEVVT